MMTAAIISAVTYAANDAFGSDRTCVRHKQRPADMSVYSPEHEVLRPTPFKQSATRSIATGMNNTKFTNWMAVPIRDRNVPPPTFPKSPKTLGFFDSGAKSQSLRRRRAPIRDEDVIRFAVKTPIAIPCVPIEFATPTTPLGIANEKRIIEAVSLCCNCVCVCSRKTA